MFKFIHKSKTKAPIRGFVLNQNLQNGAEDGDEDAHLPDGDFFESFDFGFEFD